MQFKIQKLNNIAAKGLNRFQAESYDVSSEIDNPDVILLRSQKLHDMEFGDQLKAIGRAGAGVNNIPVDRLTAIGVPVFNAPGANANAVKELVLGGMLMAQRNLHDAVAYTRALSSSGDELEKEVEGGKKRFVGTELSGRTLGVIGLGAIGVEVANAASALGMHVIGHDPGITVSNAWKLNASVDQAQSIDEVLSQSEFLTVHVPLVDATRDMINASRIPTMKDGAVVLNFARAGVVNEVAVLAALDSGKLGAYICDFPTRENIVHEKVISLPHLGASTAEAEENCAVMVADQLCDYLQNGNITNSVNFPPITLSRKSEHRLSLVHRNIPDMLGQISHHLGSASINILHMINESMGEYACTLLDTEAAVDEKTINAIGQIDGLLRVRQI